MRQKSNDSMQVIKLQSGNVKEFLSLPYRLYKKDPFWVPPLMSEQRNVLLPAKNFFLAESEYSLYIVKRKRKVVARILVGIHAPMTRKFGVRYAFFSMFEMEDIECGTLLLTTAEQWACDNKAAFLLGPWSPTNGEEQRGLLIEGFSEPPTLMNSYNPKWYQSVYEDSGFTKYEDLLALRIDVRQLPVDKFRRVVKNASERYGFYTSKLDLSHYEDELHAIHQILIEAYPPEWDENAPDWEQVVSVGESLRTMADPDFVQIARTTSGRPIAFIVGVPNYNEALIHMNGRLFPFGFLKFLWWKSKIKCIRGFMQFSIPEYRNKAAISACYLSAMDAAIEKGYEWAEASTIGEENHRSLAAVEGAGGIRYKKYRWYQKSLQTYSENMSILSDTK